MKQEPKRIVDISETIIKLSHYDPCTYGDGQSLVYTKGRNWINFGSDNRADKFIEDLLDMNEDHNAIINRLSMMVGGQGFTVPTSSDALKMYTNQPLKDKSRITDNTFSSMLPKIARDIVLYGSFALNIRWGKGNLKIGDVHHVDIRKLRIDSEGRGYWISNDWSNYRKEKYTPVFFPSFTDDPSVENSQIMYVKLPNSSHREYALPYYWPIRAALEATKELMVWYISRLKNGFNVDSVVNYPDGFPLDGQLARDMASMRDFYSGGANRKVMVTEGNTKVEPYKQSRLPEDLELLQKICNSKIRVGHGVVGSGEIFSLDKGDGGITFTTESLSQEWEAYNALQVLPMQKVITDAFDLLSRANSVDQKWTIEPYVFFANKDKSTMPENELGNTLPTQISNDTNVEQK